MSTTTTATGLRPTPRPAETAVKETDPHRADGQRVMVDSRRRTGQEQEFFGSGRSDPARPGIARVRVTKLS